MTKPHWEQARPLPPIDARDRADLERWFAARKQRTKKLGAPPWVIVKPFKDADDNAAVAAVFALHVTEETPWLVRGVLRVAEQGPLVLTRVAVEHLTDPDAELTTKSLRLPVATIRDRANAFLRYRDIGLPALDTIRPRTPAERRWDRRVAAEATKSPKRGRQGNPADHYRPLALRAVEIFQSGRRDVVKALADELGKPYPTVRDWISRAREFGLLAPVKQGRTNFHPGPNLDSKGTDG